jgi:predicted RNase H-like nuclease (RuvC/YqgF family)
MSMFDMYRPKKKRPVDPNAPPRPNLLNHEKRLKETTVTVEQVQQENQELRRRLEALEAKFANQNTYLSTLHQYVHSKFKNRG